MAVGWRWRGLAGCTPSWRLVLVTTGIPLAVQARCAALRRGQPMRSHVWYRWLSARKTTVVVILVVAALTDRVCGGSCSIHQLAGTLLSLMRNGFWTDLPGACQT